MSEPLLTDHREVMTQIIVAMRLLLQVDLPAAIAKAQRADTLGCWFDPTLWAKNHKVLSEDMEVLDAAMPLWRLANKLATKHENGENY